jgi:hypothetical protein
MRRSETRILISHDAARARGAPVDGAEIAMKLRLAAKEAVSNREQLPKCVGEIGYVGHEAARKSANWRRRWQATKAVTAKPS